MENVNTQIISEDELAHVSGGSGDGQKCYFHPKSVHQSEAERPGADPAYIWLKCAYIGPSCRACSCYGRDHCVGCYHKIDASTRELSPSNFANHKHKLMSNSYNTN